MDAPKCRFCGTRHWSREQCPEKPIFVQVPEEVPFSAHDVFTVGTDPQKYVAVKGKFDRNAYQREYMRKRRAAAKETKT